MKKSVEEIQNKLDSPDCKNSILMVTHKILQANVHARKMLKFASDNLNRSVDELQNAIFAQTVEKRPTYYKVNSSCNASNNSAALLIADAVLHKPQAVQLVASSTNNSIEMDKTWELMSELDKDELLQKKIIREL